MSSEKQPYLVGVRDSLTFKRIAANISEVGVDNEADQ